jgi:hypothetical protein
MFVIICPYVWICLWHYAYPDFRVFDFFRVEGYAFKCLRFCKFLLPQTLNGKKVKDSPLCFLSFWWNLVWQQGFFLGLCIPLVLANLVSSSELFIHLARKKPCLFCFVTTSRCFIIIILKITWMCLKICCSHRIVGSSSHLRLSPIFKKNQCQAYVTCAN